MLDTLKTIILDYQDIPLPAGVPRHLRIEPLPGKAAVCLGVRRCGKSTLMGQTIRKLLESGVSRRNILYLNFFDDRLHGLRQKGPSVIAEAYYALYPEKKNTETVYCFFDEIQVVPNWEAFVDRLMRTESCQVYLTGSSARMLSREIATQMRGRALSWELFPFSFREFLDWKGLGGTGELSTRRRLLIQRAFDQYRQVGGFPEVLDVPPYLRVRMLQEYFHTILFRDLVERYDVAHPRAVVDLARRLMDSIACPCTVNRLTEYLKNLGHKVPKTSVGDYLAWLEDAYFLFTVCIFDPSIARRNTNPKKVYCVDHALAASVASGLSANSGRLLENLVFAALRRIHPELYYYRTRSGKEVDFVVPEQGTIRRLVQVCESLEDPATRKRELAALAEAMTELNVGLGTVVTRHESERIETAAGVVQVMPAWRFLLDLPDVPEAT
ncbi:MAG TPA: ATP-binding protein [Candidatus Hydrogenedentes bacterium]|nr:ATP-binding protein [Candidatus Hydrogenedentota bacterium]HOK89123.1 ATP-binding protein [Candidatus Hydrogenedentota bacterium]